MQHQHPLATPAGAHLEARAVTGKGVQAIQPGLFRVACWVVRIKLAVVEAHLKQPVGRRIRWRIGQIAQLPGSPPRGVQQRSAVAIQHPLQIPLGGTARVRGFAPVHLVHPGERVALAGTQSGPTVLRLVEISDAIALVIA